MSRPRIVLVSAMDLNHVIGRDGALPWHMPADMKHYRRVTTGKPIVMGRKTWESLSGPLPKRRNVVITRQPDYTADGAEVVDSPEAALALLADSPEVMVIGGSGVYAAFLDRADELNLTMIHHAFEGDTRFPDIHPDRWRVVSREDHQPDEKNPYPYSFLLMQRH